MYYNKSVLYNNNNNVFYYIAVLYHIKLSDTSIRHYYNLPLSSSQITLYIYVGRVEYGGANISFLHNQNDSSCIYTDAYKMRENYFSL